MDVQGNAQPERVRKRRRRTMACTQCRTRKLRCDREYPTCSRCLKSRTPNKCTYEDGFLWQQPTTVPTNAFASDRGSAVPMPRDTPVDTPRDSGIPMVSNRPEPFPISEPFPTSEPPRLARAGGPMHHEYHGLTGNALAPPYRSRPHDRERKDCFLETVLGVPKAAVNQEPYLNTGLLQRPKRPAPATEHDMQTPSQVDDPHIDEEEDPLSPTDQLDLSPRMMMRGRETKTRFSGSGIFASLVAQFPDIKPFADEIRLSTPIFTQLQSDLRRVKRGLLKHMVLNRPFPDPTTASLINMLPSRGVVDELVGLYITYIESTHRILHVPSFLRELDQFWAMLDSPASISAAFTVQVLLVLACAWNLADFASLQSKSAGELKCQCAVEWTLHAGQWIENLHTKRPEITSMRLSILLILARNSHGMKRSQAWLTTSTLVKQAMMAGYHRDPSRYTRISAFNKEMRRRIWTTIVELDLQIALDRGMPPSVQSFDYDTAPGLNIYDDEIHEDSTEVPGSRPLNEITDSSFQSVLSRSLPVRLQACSLMHSPRINCRYEDIQRLDGELNRHLSRIPAWVAADPSDIITQNKIILWKGLIETKLCQSLLSVHTPFAIEALQETLFAPSARTRMDAATRILSTQRRLHDISRTLSLCMLGEWTIQAYISICQVLHTTEFDASQPSSISSAFILHNIPGIPESLLSLVETALIALEERSLLVTKGAKDYYFLSTIVGLVKARLWPAQATMYKQQVVERVLSFAQILFSRHMNCDHLGDKGMGNFKDNQVAAFMAAPTMVPVMQAEFDPNGMHPPLQSGGMPSGDFDPFLDIFDWEDLTTRPISFIKSLHPQRGYNPMYIIPTMHHLPLLLSIIIAVAAPLAGAIPAQAGTHSATQVYQTTDKYPLANPGNIPAHDPNIILHDEHYYLFKGGINIPIFKSANISGPWEKLGTVLAGDSIIRKGNRARPWAPTTIERNGTFYCYYTLSARGSRNSAIGVATTTALDGSPWTDHGVVINTGTGAGSGVWPYTITNAIDASVIVDRDSGQAYLNYGSFWRDIWQVPLADDLLSVKDADKPDAVQLTFHPRVKPKPEEGSWMSFRNGFYYVWFSHGKCCNFQSGFPARGKEYSIRVGRSKSVRGPFEDKDGRSLLDGGGTVVYGSNHGVVYAPGGLGILAGNNDVSDILYYHYLNTSIGFEHAQAQLGWNYLDYEDGWPVPTEGKDATTANVAFGYGPPSWGYLASVLGVWLCMGP
ncbi:CAZyme family GH43 [Penicillium roqueforti]|nr:CAZyme family GH43 [Penicillium roqueforti]